MQVFGALAKALTFVGSDDRQAGPAGLFSGLFVGPSLGWPAGVQEEDRDRPWAWAVGLTEPTPPEVVTPTTTARSATRHADDEAVAVFIDFDVPRVPVQRVLP
jgi:hypothetical protein